MDLDLGVGDSRRAYELFDDVVGVLELIVAGRSGDEERVFQHRLELVPFQRPVVEARRQAEAVRDEYLLARAVAVVHAAHLRQRHVRFVYEKERVLREEVEQRARRVASLASVEIARIVLDARAVADLEQHFKVVLRAHTQPFFFEIFALAREARAALLHLLLYRARGVLYRIGARDVMLRREDARLLLAHHAVAADRVYLVYTFYLVVEEVYAQCSVAVRREYLHRLAAASERSGDERHVVALVVVREQLHHEVAPLPALAAGEAENRVLVVLALAESVDARDARDDDDVAPFKQRLRRHEAQLLYALVDGGVLFDINVGGRYVGFRLVVVVVGDEVINGVFREELLELAVELRGEGLVVGEDERRAVEPRYDVRHREGLAAASDAEQRLMRPVLFEKAAHKLFDGLRLVAGEAEGRGQLKFIFHFVFRAHPPQSN